MEPGTDVFLSHNWGKDESGRDNHHRVFLINEELKGLGYKTWFDEEKMAGNIAEKMSRGIEQTKGVIVFITRKYYKKVNGKNDGDNCKKEFMYASEKKTPSKMVPVVMEECMCDTATWIGLIGIHLCGRMFVDMSGDLENRSYLCKQIKLLEKELQDKKIQPTSGIVCFYFTFQYLGYKKSHQTIGNCLCLIFFTSFWKFISCKKIMMRN